jgi:hypothetical protein
MTRDPGRQSGFYWVRFEGAEIVAEYTADGVGCNPEGRPHWHVPGSDGCWRDNEVCELLSGRLQLNRNGYRRVIRALREQQTERETPAPQAGQGVTDPVLDHDKADF